MTETNQPTYQQELLKRYLLGNLSESEQDRIEELYFTKDDHLDELLIAENQLLEDYLAGNLTHKEARDFKRNYLTTPEKRLRLQLVKRIHEQANSMVKAPADLTVEQPQVEKKSWWHTVLAFLYPRQPVSRFAMALAILVIVVVGVLLVNRNSQLRNQLAQAEQEKSRLRQEDGQLRQQLAEQREQKLAERPEQKDEVAPSPAWVDELLANRNSQLRNQLAQAEQEKSRLRQDQAQLRQQLAEQRRWNDEIAKSLDQVNESLANRDSQLGNQLAQAEQEKNRLQQDEAQLRQQLAEQRQRNDEIAKSLDHLNEQRRLLDEELSRQRQADAAPLPSFEFGVGEQPRAGFNALRGVQPRHKIISLPKEAKLVRLTFNVNTAGLKSYRLAFVGVNGIELWSRSDELPQPATPGISLHIPAGLLNPGDYTFKLELLDQDGAMRTPGRYPVRVERQ